MGKYFGTDGIRGSAEIFTTEFLQSVAKGLLEYDKPQQHNELKVLLGGDTRESTEWIIRDLEAALETLGVEYGNVGVLSTPAINFAFYEMGYDYAIDVTASHNTSEDNGLKIFERGDNYGVKLSDSGKKVIENALDEGSGYGLMANELREDLHEDALERYLWHLRKYLNKTFPKNPNLVNEHAKVNFEGLKIGIDCANGATSVVGGKIFEEYGAKTLVINSDDRYGHLINRNCGCLHIEELQRVVKERKLDFGVAFDGDGDRCLMVDHLGQVVDGDQIMAILANYMNLDKMVATVMCNQGLIEWAKKHNVMLVTSNVGDQNVFEKMTKEDIRIGGEQSGHIILPDEGMGDGMLTALMMARVISAKKSSLSELAARIPRFPQIMANVPANKEQKMMLVENEALKDLISEYEDSLNSMNGRMLVRPSGTEQLIRITMWGTNEKEIQSIMDEFVVKINKILKGAAA
ncbi:hypothetical protein IJK16_03575 [Candidatus Saccharibacteria bacterium]|nr:hypothetical protein [Candidatus Saccharibacteria bacterium]